MPLQEQPPCYPLRLLLEWEERQERSWISLLWWRMVSGLRPLRHHRSSCCCWNTKESESHQEASSLSSSGSSSTFCSHHSKNRRVTWPHTHWFPSLTVLDSRCIFVCECPPEEGICCLFSLTFMRRLLTFRDNGGVQLSTTETKPCAGTELTSVQFRSSSATSPLWALLVGVEGEQFTCAENTWLHRFSVHRTNQVSTSPPTQTNTFYSVPPCWKNPHVQCVFEGKIDFCRKLDFWFIWHWCNLVTPCWLWCPRCFWTPARKTWRDEVPSAHIVHGGLFPSSCGFICLKK